ncbi:ataxin-7-like protein 3 isoform X2 [Tachysurus fulvidraco]|uniref:ataxin-7-like protein 3 isoform X2 n=1 Tax=Tachysurus fulvidraco TaxID=1234273 RepID=UPI001FEFC5F7|nr:ataxin-7-like protein 3 isoform X2 [Tachysurus fulvidraco]
MKMDDMSLSGLDNTKLEALAHDIYSDLVEDACLGLCFEVHRAVKQGYFFLDETDQESMKDFEIVDQPGVDIFGQVYNQWKNKECVCPNCNRSIAASRFAPHLEKCLGMGRNSSRIANRRIANSNNTSKSESDQEDNDDVNDNDWSYGSEKKPKKRKSDKNPNSPRRSKSLKHKNGELSGTVNPDHYKYNFNSGISYETLGPEDLRFLLTTQCGVVSEHTKKMCTRWGPQIHMRSTLPDPESVLENDGYDTPDGQLIMSRLQWDGSSDISPSDSASSKASTNNSDSKRPKKKKKPSSLLVSSAGVCEREKGGERERGGGTAGGGGGNSSSSVIGMGGAGTSSSGNSQSALALSNRKKRPRPPPPPAPNIYDDLN